MAEMLPETTEELTRYLVRYMSSIYVRAEVDGRLQTVALDELPPSQFVWQMKDFMKQFRETGFIPHRVISAEEGKP